MSEYDAPNQQVVRPDGSGPADEGSGGSVPSEPKQSRTKPEPTPEPVAADPETTETETTG